VTGVQTCALPIFPPDSAHGWTGRQNEQAEIYVLQFDWIPHAIRALVPSGGVASVRLTTREISLFKSVYGSFQNLSRVSDTTKELLTQRNLASLGLMLAARAETSRKVTSTSRQSSVVQASLKRYREELPKGPLLTTISSFVNLSPSQLRRLYKSVLHRSPRSEFLKWRMQRAKYLLAITNDTVQQISDEVGYGSEAAFCRTFKRYTGKSPQLWRRFQREGIHEWKP